MGSSFAIRTYTFSGLLYESLAFKDRVIAGHIGEKMNSAAARQWQQLFESKDRSVFNKNLPLASWQATSTMAKACISTGIQRQETGVTVNATHPQLVAKSVQGGNIPEPPTHLN